METEHLDSTGHHVDVGDRVYCPPRLYGAPYELADPYDEIKTPSISGRVVSIFEGTRGLVCAIREAHTQHVRSVPLNLVRWQSGRTQAEKDLDGARERRNQRPKVRQVVRKP